MAEIAPATTLLQGVVNRDAEGAVQAHVLIRAPATAMLYSIDQAESYAAELAKVIAGVRAEQARLAAEGEAAGLAFVTPQGRA